MLAMFTFACGGNSDKANGTTTEEETSVVNEALEQVESVVDEVGEEAENIAAEVDSLLENI